MAAASPARQDAWLDASALLSDQRTFVVTAASVLLRASPGAGTRAIVRLQHAVIGRLRRSLAGTAWCQVEVGGYRGFLPQAAVWGSDADAAPDPRPSAHRLVPLGHHPSRSLRAATSSASMTAESLRIEASCERGVNRTIIAPSAPPAATTG